MKRTTLFILLGLLAFLIAPAAAQDNGVLYIYSARHYGAMESTFVAFEEATGIEVRVTDGESRELLTRLRNDIARGNRSVADLFLAIDAGVLSLAAEEGLLQPIDSEVLNSQVPESQRDPEGRWFALSQRVRTAVYNPANVTEDEIANNLNTYADLADPVWEGRLCMRPAAHIYTVSLFSSLIHHLGEEAALEVAEGWASNVTRYINSDTSLIRAVAAGECDVTIVNHYYLGRLAASEDAADQETFTSVAIQWLNQDDTGVFYNVNGAGIVANAANYDNALLFLEFMSATENQCGAPECFPGGNYEYPVNPEAEVNEFIEAFGEFELDLGYALWEYGQLQQTATDLLAEAGFGFSEN